MYQKRNNELHILTIYLSGYYKQYYLREISRLTKVPLKTTQNTIAFLEKNKILKSSVNGKNKYFKLNMDNIQTKLLLLQSEIYITSLFLEEYPVFKTFSKDIKTNNTIIVFGSFAKFKADKSSDLDLFIVQQKEEELPFHLLPYKIHEISISESSFVKALKKQENLIKEIEENHIILNNHSFFMNIMWKYYGK